MNHKDDPRLKEFDEVVNVAIVASERIPVSKMMAQTFSGSNLVCRLTSREIHVTQNIVDVVYYIEDMLPGMIRVVAVNPAVHKTITNRVIGILLITFLLYGTAALANEPPEMLISKKPAFAEKHPVWAKIGRVAEKTIYIAGSIAQCIAPFMGRGH